MGPCDEWTPVMGGNCNKWTSDEWTHVMSGHYCSCPLVFHSVRFTIYLKLYYILFYPYGNMKLNGETTLLTYSMIK